MAQIAAHHGLFKNTNLHVDDTGGFGRPVVLIHGWPLVGEAFSGQVPALVAAGYRVVSYDRRGCGRSDKPKSGYDTLTEDLHTLLVALDLNDVTLVGFSMGGGEVARYFSASTAPWPGRRAAVAQAPHGHRLLRSRHLLSTAAVSASSRPRTYLGTERAEGRRRRSAALARRSAFSPAVVEDLLHGRSAQSR